MASSLSLDAKLSIERTGAYRVKDANKGNQFAKFFYDGYPTKTTVGLDFVARNTQEDPVVWEIVTSIIEQPIWGFLRLYSDVLDSNYAWFFHSRSRDRIDEPIRTLLVQLWEPQSKLIHYEGSHVQYVDPENATDWGLLRKPRWMMRREDIIEREESLPDGGYTIIDSRLGWTCTKGKFVNIGFVTDGEIQFWQKMEIPDTEALQEKVAELAKAGFKTNFTFVKESR